MHLCSGKGVEKFALIPGGAAVIKSRFCVDSYDRDRILHYTSPLGGQELACLAMIGMKSAADIKEPKRADPMPLQELGRVLLAVMGGVLLVLLLVGGYRFYHLSPEGLYKGAYVEYQLPSQGDYQIGATRVEMAYRAGNYDSVIRESKKVQGFTDQDFLLIGLSYMHKGDYSSAIEPLRLVNLWNESDYKEEGEYYLALAYLRNKDYDKSLEMMQRIRRNPDHAYYPQVTEKLVRNVRILKWR